MKMVDLTGKPPSSDDLASAIRAVKIAIVKNMVAIMRVDPQLAINLPNILRILIAFRIPDGHGRFCP